MQRVASSCADFNTKCVLTRRLRACSSEVLGVIAVLAGVPLAAQSSAPPSRPVPVGDTSIFAPLMLPTANAFRTGSGAPGAAYWQNRADYATAATLDTAAMRVSGTMTLTYTNNSPDTLRYLWLQTEQNAFRTNSANSLIFPHEKLVRDVIGGRAAGRERRGQTHLHHRFVVAIRQR